MPAQISDRCGFIPGNYVSLKRVQGVKITMNCRPFREENSNILLGFRFCSSAHCNLHIGNTTHIPANGYTFCTLKPQVQAFTIYIYTQIQQTYASFPTHMSICAFTYIPALSYLSLLDAAVRRREGVWVVSWQ